MATGTIGGIVKKLQDIMRNDAGINGDAQRIEQMAWLFFLKVYDAQEEKWEFHNPSYKSIIPDKYRWRSWAPDHKDGKAMTGDELLSFVNNELFPALKNLPVAEGTSINQAIVRSAFEDNNNYMKKGILLRQVVNVIDDLDLTNHKNLHAFGEIYETILKSLQSAGNAGEFYTPRAVTDFMAQMVKPKLGETVADFACGTGGFLTSAIKILEKQIKKAEQRSIVNNSIFGIEKKALPHLLCATNMFLHEVDNPDIEHGNALEKNVREYEEKDKFDVILMNPPYGGSELDTIKANFPAAMRSSETADLFLVLIMHRLKKKGRAAVVLPDGFLFGNDNAKLAIKEKLLTEFNLHTIIRLPKSVFAPYTSINTNLLFFDGKGPTEKTWFYRLDMPEGYKNFSKTKPMLLEHFKPILNWWKNRQEIEEDGIFRAKAFTLEELRSGCFNLDLCGFPQEQEEILSPNELIRQYQEERQRLNAELDRVLSEIMPFLPKEDWQ